MLPARAQLLLLQPCVAIERSRKCEGRSRFKLAKTAAQNRRSGLAAPKGSVNFTLGAASVAEESN